MPAAMPPNMTSVGSMYVQCAMLLLAVFLCSYLQVLAMHGSRGDAFSVLVCLGLAASFGRCVSRASMLSSLPRSLLCCPCCCLSTT